jgi:hypothetical protein
MRGYYSNVVHKNIALASQEMGNKHLHFQDKMEKSRRVALIMIVQLRPLLLTMHKERNKSLPHNTGVPGSCLTNHIF